jgi:hypothetical protein
MDKHHDSRTWTKTITSPIKNDMNLTFRTSTSVSHLRCQNQDCIYIARIHCTSQVNEMEWDGFTPMIFSIGQPAPNGSTLVCKICKVPLISIATCDAKIYYVFGTTNMIHACVHLEIHKHLIKAGENQEFKEMMQTLTREQVKNLTPKATNSAIVMEATKELVDELLMDSAGASTRKYDLEELVPVFNKCKYMSSPSIKKDMIAFKYIWRFGIMDGIAMLRGCSHWAYV